jgi:hypothetical protein
VTATCRDAARQTRFRIICPELIPHVPIVHDHSVYGAIVYPGEPNFYMLTFNNGDNGRALHWIVGGGTRAAVDKWLLSDRFNEVKGRPKLIERARLRGRPVSVYRFPDYPAGGPNGGHVAALVDAGGLIVFASPHGYAHQDAALAMAADLLRIAQAPGS